MNIDQDINNPFLKESEVQSVKVLLVDDLEENLISLETLLLKENENITYLFARSGEEALKIALQEELALILLDVQMPEMNGYEVARYLRDISKTRDIPIIFVTAIDKQDEHMIEGFEAGAVDYLFKPLNPYITKAKVSNFVRYYLQKKELEIVNKQTQELNQELEERVKARTKELTRVNKDLDNFVYTASHDLKAPIHNIEGLVFALQETLNMENPDKEEIATLMQMVNNSINKFKLTLEDLTEVAKIQYEEAVSCAEVDFKEILEDVKVNIQGLIQEYDAEIYANFSNAPALRFSKKNLRSILYNLISNSIKYSAPDRKPEITISTALVNEFVVLTVRDNGLGFRMEDKEKLFGMFKRLHSHVDGTGVGLAMVKRIVENSDGKIEFESEVGRGTVFKVYLNQH